MSDESQTTSEAFLEHLWGTEARAKRDNRLRGEATRCLTRAAQCDNPRQAAYWRREAAVCNALADANMPGWKP